MMGMTGAQRVSFSVHFQASPGIRPWAPTGAHLDCPGSSFWLPRELIFCGRKSELIFKVARTRVSRLKHDCALSRKPSIAAMLAVTISVSAALFPRSHPPRTASCLIMHAAQRSCTLVPRFMSARFTNFIELPLHTSQV